MSGIDVSTPSRTGTARRAPTLQGGGNKNKVPAALAKVGIHSVSDNLFPGDVLNVGRAFMMVFRTELEARLVRVPGQEGGRDGTR